MSLAPDQSTPDTASLRHPTPVNDADVIEIGPWVTTRNASPAWTAGIGDDTVILGRSAPHWEATTQIGDPHLTTNVIGGIGSVPVGADGSSPIVDQSGLNDLLINRRERYYPAPPPPRVQHQSWMLSSLVIAGGGIAAVLAAGAVTDVPLIAMVALISTVLCGAILVAAQVTQEVRRSRSPVSRQAGR